MFDKNKFGSEGNAMNARSILVAALALGGTALQAQDWDGFYAGMSLGTANVTFDYHGGSPDATDTASPVVAFFGGYNYDTGSNIIIGGEVSVANARFREGTLSTDLMWEVRGRAGYALGKFLPYASFGVAKTDYGLDGENHLRRRGVTYGIGAEMMVSDSLSLQLDYSRIRIEYITIDVYAPPGHVDLISDSFTLGAAWHF
jgi:opacity protein-like surface antigen